MSGDAVLENGPQPDEKFIDLIKAVQEKGDGERLIPIGRRHTTIEITAPYNAIIQYYIETQYPQVRLI